MQLFYHPDIRENVSVFSFDASESKHLVKVLRKQPGDVISVTNGKNRRFEAKIIDANPKKCTLSIIRTEHKPAKNYSLHLAVAPTKMNDRYEWFLEKAVEIGVDTITPVICDRSERRTIKPERFRKIIVAAMKQSLQYYLPELCEAITFRDFMTQAFKEQCFIAHCGTTERFPLQHSVQAGQQITMLIGPEGDFSEEEIDIALKKGFIPVSLGRTRLRTETAAIAACHTVALVNGIG